MTARTATLCMVGDDVSAAAFYGRYSNISPGSQPGVDSTFSSVLYGGNKKKAMFISSRRRTIKKKKNLRLLEPALRKTHPVCPTHVTQGNEFVDYFLYCKSTAQKTKVLYSV